MRQRRAFVALENELENLKQQILDQKKIIENKNQIIEHWE